MESHTTIKQRLSSLINIEMDRSIRLDLLDQGLNADCYNELYPMDADIQTAISLELIIFDKVRYDRTIGAGIDAR